MNRPTDYTLTHAERLLTQYRECAAQRRRRKRSETGSKFNGKGEEQYQNDGEESNDKIKGKKNVLSHQFGQKMEVRKKKEK